MMPLKLENGIQVRIQSISKGVVKAFLDKHKKVMNPPKGYHRIKVHLVICCQVLMAGHKARLVADGPPKPLSLLKNIYSGVVFSEKS